MTREDVERMAQERDEKAMESRAWAEAHIDGGRPEHAQGWLLAAQHAEATAAMLRALLARAEKAEAERDAARAAVERLREAGEALATMALKAGPLLPASRVDLLPIRTQLVVAVQAMRAAIAGEARDE